MPRQALAGRCCRRGRLQIVFGRSPSTPQLRTTRRLAHEAVQPRPQIARKERHPGTLALGTDKLRACGRRLHRRPASAGGCEPGRGIDSRPSVVRSRAAGRPDRDPETREIPLAGKGGMSATAVTRPRRARARTHATAQPARQRCAPACLAPPAPPEAGCISSQRSGQATSSASATTITASSSSARGTAGHPRHRRRRVTRIPLDHRPRYPGPWAHRGTVATPPPRGPATAVQPLTPTTITAGGRPRRRTSPRRAARSRPGAPPRTITAALDETAAATRTLGRAPQSPTSDRDRHLCARRASTAPQRDEAGPTASVACHEARRLSGAVGRNGQGVLTPHKRARLHASDADR